MALRVSTLAMAEIHMVRVATQRVEALTAQSDVEAPKMEAVMVTKAGMDDGAHGMASMGPMWEMEAMKELIMVVKAMAAAPLEAMVVMMVMLMLTVLMAAEAAAVRF